jgi:hypothetical protein
VNDDFNSQPRNQLSLKFLILCSWILLITIQDQIDTGGGHRSVNFRILLTLGQVEKLRSTVRLTVGLVVEPFAASWFRRSGGKLGPLAHGNPSRYDMDCSKQRL